MHAQTLAFALAISGALAAPALRQRDDCQNNYSSCVAAGTPEVACSCTLSACLGEDNARNRAFCATATASIAAAATSAPASSGACATSCSNAYNTCRVQPSANRAQCASDYSSCLGYSPFDNSGSLVTPTACSSTTSATATAAASTGSSDACATSCSNAYNTCRGQPSANRAQCAADYSSCLGYLPFDNSGSLVTPTACSSTASATATATATASISGIPGGCNPAHPGSCPTTVSAAAPAAATAASATSSGTGWTVENLIRYCAADKSGCDYNFKINTNDGSAVSACTISRTNVANGPTESFYDVPCNSGSPFKISWGYSDQFGESSAFAVLTAVNNEKKSKAYFGVSNVNSGAVTASSPLGSGNFGNIGPETVYSF